MDTGKAGKVLDRIYRILQDWGFEQDITEETEKGETDF
jgi:hypothetical protein